MKNNKRSTACRVKASGLPDLAALRGLVDPARLLAVPQLDGELEQAVETTTRQAWCRACGVQALPHGRRVVRVRDLHAADRPVTLLWIKRLRVIADTGELVEGIRASGWPPGGRDLTPARRL